FDRAEEIPNRLDLLALVEGAAFHQHVRKMPRFECANIRTRDIVAETVEAPKQDAYVTRLDRHALVGGLALGDRPSALLDQPMHVGGGRIGQRFVDLPLT